MDTLTVQDEIEQVYQRYRDNPAFATFAASGARFVPGCGPLNSPLMLLGEAPGADEDRLGIPFVGAAGRLLDELLKEAGLPREMIRIDNVLPWRPPGNRTPYPFEIAAASPLVIAKIAVTRPKILITLGAPAWQAATARKLGPFSDHRGKWLGYSSWLGVTMPWDEPVPGAWECQLLPLYHPSFVLREPRGPRRDGARAAILDGLRSVLGG